uniref:Uncharacterized protein n=1 Tax=Trichobilharzia regenti TaxID=157069 RepID=A0AA85JMF1_TRIRE|nr:unnamed protein product [Trichobilharzia regenti]
MLVSPAFLTAVFSSVLLTNVHGTHGWDYFVFSLEWPPTYCSSHTCNLPRHMRQQFNIHGLWPTIWPNGSPTNCSRSDFNVKSIEPIYKDLQTQWANLEDFDDPEDFWKHEWNKHGVCSVHSAVISNELDYFNTSLAIKAKVNLLRRLESIGIKPNNKVNLKRDGLLVQLKKLFNVNVLIYCALKHRQPAKLSEIRVCMNPSLDFISCPKSEETEEGEHHSQQQQQQYSVNVCYADEFRVNNNNDVCDTHLPWFNLFPSCPSRQEQKGQQQQPMCTLPMLTSNSPCPEELIFPDFT